MHVFLLPPFFILGIGLGLLALRSGSLLPGILVHGSCYAWLQFGPLLFDNGSTSVMAALAGTGQYVVAGACTLLAASLLWWQNRRRGAGRMAALLAVPHPVIIKSEIRNSKSETNPKSELPI
jgi:hypothetical protein